jgi:hypothetical protein
MKIAGKKIVGSNIEYIVIPRPLSFQLNPETQEPQEVNNDIVFKATAVLSFENFEKICPPPTAPLSKRPGGESFQNVEHKDYKAKELVWGLNRTNWLILESLKATDDLEWETVKADDPSTWGNWNKELEDSGLNWKEISLIREGIWKANALNDEKIDQAKKRFLASLGAGQQR